MNNYIKQKSLELKSERLQLTTRFLNGKSRDFPQNHALLIDEYFRDSYEKSAIGPMMEIIKNPYAIIALGGYGRQEQCLYSDVDILFLFAKKVPQKAEALVQEIIYPLWDIGMDVGHCTRSIKECLSLAKSEFEVLTSLLDARFICGISPVYTNLLSSIRKKITTRQTNRIISRLVKTNEARHRAFGDSASLLEPNLKEGQGGLRDFHSILWLAKIKIDLQHPRDMEYHGYFSHNEYAELEKSLAFVQKIRTWLHHVAGKKYDRLHYEYQVELSELLGYKKKNGLEPVESFLKDLHNHMETIKQNHLIFLHEIGVVEKRFEFGKAVKTLADFSSLKVEKSLKIEKGMLNFTSSMHIKNRPELLIKIFEESTKSSIPLSMEARRLIREFLYLIDSDFKSLESILVSFENILMAEKLGVDILETMHNTGFLSAYIPEFAQVTGRIEYDTYHVHPVDRHMLLTVGVVKSFGSSQDPTTDTLCSDLYKQMSSKNLLLWAALLHDIGKGRHEESHCKAGAETAGEICLCKGMEVEDADTISFLIENHHLLINTATRRDINDEETAISCAQIILNIDILKMLYLLTVADLVATGPLAWNEWTAALLEDLFLKILNILEMDELANDEAMQTIEAKDERLKNSEIFPEFKDDVQDLIDIMSHRYFLYTHEFDIRNHILLYRKFEENDFLEKFVWAVRKSSETDTRIVTICSKNSPGFFSKVAGAFTLNHMDILEVQVYTWKNQVVLNEFKLKPPPDRLFEDEKWKKAEKDLHAALNGKLDLTAAIGEMNRINPDRLPRTSKESSRIVVNNRASDFYTIIEVYANDRPGLLYYVADALYKCRLDIRTAQVSTKMDQAVDVFYVRDFDGQKVDDKKDVEEIKTSIAAVLSFRSSNPAK